MKVPKNGTLANFVASDLGGSPTVYKYLQANTMLELLYDGTQFIIIENPVVISGSNFRINADGSRLVNEVTSNNMNSVTSNAVYDVAAKVETQNFSNSYKVGVFVFRRIGKIVTMQTGGGDWNNLPVAEYTNLFNIPEKFRPSIDVALFEQTGSKITIQILVSGLVRVYNYESQVSAFNGYYNGCWLAAN